jgi:type I restriction enzyme S subunit
LGATTSPHVNVGDVKNVLTYRPPEIEQIFIGKYIRTVHSRLICEERCRKKLLSQKDGLMHDLLTGRVRVKVTEPDKQEAAA